MEEPANETKAVFGLRFWVAFQCLRFTHHGTHGYSAHEINVQKFQLKRIDESLNTSFH